MKNNIFSILCFSLFFMSIGVYAQENKAETPKSATATAADLAKKLANPISSLISVPFQNNTDIGIGRFEGTRNTLNFQPVIPLKLSENLNLITRVIIPVV